METTLTVGPRAYRCPPVGPSRQHSPHTQGVWHRAAAVVVAMTLGCGSASPEEEGAADPQPVRAVLSFEEAFQVSVRIRLEENEQVLTVSPAFVAVDGGQMLVTDRIENQVRLYDGQGGLVWHFGREGQGPGELMAPRPAVALGDEIVVADSQGRITIWQPATRSVSAVVNLPGQRLADLDALGTDRILISTRHLRPGLSIWNRHTGEIEKEFFEPAIPQQAPTTYVSFTWIGSDVRDDTVASTVSIYDTLYLHSREGEPTAKLPLHLLDVGLPESAEGLGRTVRLSDWLADTALILQPAWYDQDRIAIAIRDRGSPGADIRFSLLLLDLSTGESTMITDTPQFLFTQGGTFFFFDPQVLERNVVVGASLLEKARP